MDRIATATKATDLFGAGKHGWKNRNIGLGIEPTDFNADWCNGVQEELLAIIEAAGIVPAAATRNQVLLALRAAGVFTTPAALDNTTKAATTAFVRAELLSLGNAVYAALFASVLSGNGYQKLPNGFLLQWGQASIAGVPGSNFNYPIVFPTAVYVLLPIVNDIASTGDFATGFISGLTQGAARLNNAVTRTVSYIAIGK